MFISRFSRLRRTTAALALSGAAFLLVPSASYAQSARLVISQIYAGATASTGTANYRQQYVELFNGTASTINLTGYTLQYANLASLFDSTNTANSVSLSGSIASGQFYLIGLSGGANQTTAPALPTPDATGAERPGFTGGKFALASDSSTVTATDGPNSVFSSNVVDFVGYGSAYAWEGTGAAGVLGRNTAAVRQLNGAGTNYLDTNNNDTDFVVTSAFTPHNSSSNFTGVYGTPFVASSDTPEPAALPLLGMGLVTSFGMGVTGGVKRRKAAKA